MTGPDTIALMCEKLSAEIKTAVIERPQGARVLDVVERVSRKHTIPFREQHMILFGGTVFEDGVIKMTLCNMDMKPSLLLQVTITGNLREAKRRGER